MKAVLNVIFLVLFFYTIPSALNNLVLPTVGLDTLEQPWLFTVQASLWAVWVSMELTLLGMLELVKKPYQA